MLCGRLVADGVLYAESEIGHRFAFDIADGFPFREVDMGSFGDSRSCTVSDGVVYFGSRDGRVYAFAVPRP